MNKLLEFIGFTIGVIFAIAMFVFTILWIFLPVIILLGFLGGYPFNSAVVMLLAYIALSTGVKTSTND